MCATVQPAVNKCPASYPLAGSSKSQLKSQASKPRVRPDVQPAQQVFVASYGAASATDLTGSRLAKEPALLLAPFCPSEWRDDKVSLKMCKLSWKRFRQLSRCSRKETLRTRLLCSFAPFSTCRMMRSAKLSKSVEKVQKDGDSQKRKTSGCEKDSVACEPLRCSEMVCEKMIIDWKR